jgi:hypothetical protein
MALRFLFKFVNISPGNVLFPYWGPRAQLRPAIDLYAVGPFGLVQRLIAQIDSGSNYIVLEPSLVPGLGLSPPFSRQWAGAGAGGHQLPLGFPPDGEVSLFVTDYREYCFLPAPLIGFHVPPPGAPATITHNSVLGITGFLQHFKTLIDPDPASPAVELEPLPGFPGSHGPVPRPFRVHDFIHSLKPVP